MMASPSEVSFDSKPYSCSSSSLLLKSFGDQQITNNTHEQTTITTSTTSQKQQLEEFVARLEEERHKIDAFKRELPLCMQLLNDAMEASKQQLQLYRTNNNEGRTSSRPVLEEFIPIMKNSSNYSDQAGSEKSDKSNWMTSAQLWSNNDHGTKLEALDIKERKKNNGGGGGAFIPFSKERNSSPNQTLLLQQTNNNIPDLALSSSLAERDILMEEKKCSSESEIIGKREIDNGASATINEQVKGGNGDRAPADTNTTQTHRKARRCWSPALHRRFVNALQMLGGSQVATPKQIRELMKVDGLTNDEVKSHLQKYRLHTRRPSPAPQAAGTPGPQLVVLGGIWVPPDYATAAAAAAHHGAAQTLYTAHATPPHYCAPAVPQEFYPPPPPLPQLNHHHHQFHVYEPPPSHNQNSPERDLRGSGDRSESIEDGKSGSSSWKADSGEDNGGERKALIIREEAEESIGSEIKLKF